MEFEWDENKRRRNVEQHGLDFRDAVAVFNSAHVVARSRRQHEEERFIATGRVQGKFVSVVYTLRGESYQIISMRSARDEEKGRYQDLHGGRA